MENTAFRNPIVISSKRTSGAIISYSDNLLIPKGIIFPPIEIVYKLTKSDHINDFYIGSQEKLTKVLGYYCDLQSIKSEDAITWSLFGYIAYQNNNLRDDFFNELLKELHLGSDNKCNIKLWNRLPHPDTFVSGGPEIDVILLGEKYLFLIECKWTSNFGKRQGKNKNQDQLEIRKNWINRIGKKIYPRHEIFTLIVANEYNRTDELFISWDTFCNFNSLPHKELYSSYLNWKKQWINLKNAHNSKILGKSGVPTLFMRN